MSLGPSTLVDRDDAARASVPSRALRALPERHLVGIPDALQIGHPGGVAGLVRRPVGRLLDPSGGPGCHPGRHYVAARSLTPG